LRLLTNLVSVSRAKSVASEILGSGDAAVAGQQFVLKKSPLTYLQSGQGYASTLRVHVNDVAWHEVTSFYGQPAGAKVFVTREDAQQVTHVVFGDGVSGARLPSGRDNVVASYRYGSGEEVPAPGALNVVLNPLPGVRGIRNPVVMSGGSEPDPPAKVRRYAPRSVLMFDRAVSGKDYEVVAAQAPGVRRARAYWSFDATRQRAGVTLYVGDTDGAVASARTAILGARDPNRMVTVQLAEPVDFALTVALRIHPDFLREPVLAGVRHALADDDAGLFGANAVRIGQTFFDSEIHQACLSVPGVVAVSALRAVAGARRPLNLRRLPEGRFFRLVRLDLEAEG
jgi:predicted phage baseplate assembly protein